MDKYIPVFLSSVLLAGSPQVFAASTADMAVRGMIVPSACSPSLSGDGTVDHGKLSVQMLNAQAHTPLNPQEMRLSIRCEGLTLFALAAIDNRAGSSAIHPNLHGLGMTSNEEKLGSVALNLRNPLADSVPVLSIMSNNDGASWWAGTLLGHSTLIAVASPDDLSQPVAVKDLDTDITVSTLIARADSLTLLDEVPIDGHVTLEMRYL